MTDSFDKTLTTAIAQLRSDDVRVQNEGVAAVIRIGSLAISALRPLLQDANAGRRSQAMYALAQIANAAASSDFQQGLLDADQQVRAYAALGLARINHPDALNASLQTLNDGPDELHNDITPAVTTLGSIGLRAVSGLLDLLASDDEMTRLHAQRALETIVNRRYGFQPGEGFPTPEADEQAGAAWREHGNYHYDADPSARAAALGTLRRWLESLKE